MISAASIPSSLKKCSFRQKFISFRITPIFIAALILITTAFLNPFIRAEAQDLSGTWAVDFKSDNVTIETHTWVLSQAIYQGVPIIQGDGRDTTRSWKIQATYSENRISLLYIFTGDTLQTVFEGPIEDSDHLSGDWGNTLGMSGTWTAVKIAGPAIAAPVTPKTIIKNPPSVVVQQNLAILILQKFTGVGSIKLNSLSTEIHSRAKSKMNFRYNVEIVRKKDALGKAVKADLIKKTTKKDQIALKGLKSGQYTARYNVEITTKQNGRETVVGKTKFSPAASFTIGN